MKNAYIISVGICRWEGIIKTDVTETGSENVD
jgi:hypothetical protein